MLEPVREMYRGFEILLLLRHVESGEIETTFFVNATTALAQQYARPARELTGTKLHPLEASAPITDQLVAARAAVDRLLAG